MATGAQRPTVSAVVLAYERPHGVRIVLERLARLPVDEVVVYDNSEVDRSAREVVAELGGRYLGDGRNIGIAGRNRAADAATGELLLMLDDDSYPLEGAVEALVEVLRRNPTVAAAGGLVRNVGDAGTVLLDTQMGTFDWWFRAGARGEAPADGFPTFFFPEGASLLRRSAFLEVGGFYEPFFFGNEAHELSTRLIGAGWDVRYVPSAPFDHLKLPAGRAAPHDVLRMRIRNQLWYFWLRYPLLHAVPRMLGYALFDLVNALYLRTPGAWTGGVVDAWRERRTIAGDRAPIPASAISRAERRRNRMHLELVAKRPIERVLRRLRRERRPVF